MKFTAYDREIYWVAKFTTILEHRTPGRQNKQNSEIMKIRMCRRVAPSFDKGRFFSQSDASLTEHDISLTDHVTHLDTFLFWLPWPMSSPPILFALLGMKSLFREF